MGILKFRWTTILAMVLVLSGCDGVNNNNETANTDSSPLFQQPLDGKLTEQQVADYIVIRQKIIRDVRTQKLAKQLTMAEFKENSNPYPDYLHFDEIEKSAAESFNMSYDEFLWVKDRVISAQTQQLVQRYYDLNGKIVTLLDQTLERYKEINAEKLEHQEQQLMNAYMAEIKQEMSNLRAKTTNPKERPVALEYNIALVTKFKKELELLEQQALQGFNP